MLQKTLYPGFWWCGLRGVVETGPRWEIPYYRIAAFSPKEKGLSPFGASADR